MAITIKIPLKRLPVLTEPGWRQMPADEQKPAARRAAAVYDTVADTARHLARQYREVSEAINEVDVMGELSPEAERVLGSWPHPVPDDSEGRALFASMLADMSAALTEASSAADKDADRWRALIDELFMGETGAL